MPDPAHATRRAILAAAEERNRWHRARLAGEPGAAEAFAGSRAFIDRLTAPDALAALARVEPDALEYAVCFLEAHPRCPDSGFAIRDLVRALKPAAIPEAAAARLRAALLDIVRQPARDEFKHLRQLALKVADSDLLSALDTLAETAPDDSPARANARALGDYLTRRHDDTPWA